MRRVVSVCVLLAACAIFAAPAAAQSEQDRWMLNAQFGPSFGTLGTTPNFDATGGYKFSEKLSVIGEFGGLSHAPFAKAAAIAPAVSTPGGLTDPKTHVNGYYYNANLMVTPWNWGPITPYATGGFGAFTGSTVARFDTGQSTLRQYDSVTNLATNVGGGLSYRVNRWFGVNGDYRHFFVDANAIEHVNRFAAGISLYIK